VLHVVYFEPPVDSSTIQDLHHVVLSRTYAFISRTFYGLENPGKNPGFSRMYGNPALGTESDMINYNNYTI